MRRRRAPVLYANGNEPHCSLVGPFAGRGPFQDVGKAAGSNIWERPVVRCCVLDGIPIWPVDIGWLIYWVAASGQTRDEAIRRGWWWALGGVRGFGPYMQQAEDGCDGKTGTSRRMACVEVDL